ncbi:MAG TPA: histidine phosphotransferase family protein [Novosphingobium sp.]|nr:histidine phosphotransferase family protein [Novosphingobium sp.]
MSDTLEISGLELAALLCSRLCHDMLSPVGALSNGLELLADEKDADMRGRIVDLLEQSAKTSADKLKFFRLAFGAAGGFGEMVPVDEARSVIDSLVGNNGRIEARWAVEGALPKPAVKTLLNFAMIGIEALVRGGTLDLGAELREGESEIVVRATGPRLAFDPLVGKALQGTLAAGELSSKTAPAAMLRQLASALGGEVQSILTEDALVMGAVLPIR